MGGYGLHERVFAPLPRNSVRASRHREVERFRSHVLIDRRGRWNSSTQDDLHPFPERLPKMKGCYNGVDVVETHFPETIKGTSFLRLSETAKPEVWRTNVSKALFSNRYNFQCAALAVPESPLSYLAKLIVEDNSEAKKRLQGGWQSSTWVDNRIHRSAEKSKDYVGLNKAKKILDGLTYTTPRQRVKEINEAIRTDKALRRAAAKETPMTLFTQYSTTCPWTPENPTVYKMSNIDEWWHRDPVAVAEGQTALKESLRKNKYSSFHPARTRE